MREKMKKHQHDYILDIWKTYSIQELGWWVALFSKRATHRKNKEKRKKDLHDAKNYLHMIEMKLQHQANNCQVKWTEI